MPTRPPVHSPPHGSAAQARRKRDEWRGSPADRGYDNAWRKVRAIHLKDEPLCRFCYAHGVITSATMVDHIEPIALRPELRLVDANLRSLCDPCHNAHTARQVAAGHVGVHAPRQGVTFLPRVTFRHP